MKKKPTTPYTFRYNKIDSQLIGKNVLEIGCGINVMRSHLASKLLDIEYICIDPSSEKQFLFSKQANILTYEIKKKYDTILMIEVLEHIHLRDWLDVVKKLKLALIDGGNLIISVPAHQKLNDYLNYWNTSYWEIHTVFDITKKALKKLFPDFQIRHIRYLVFNFDQKNVLWASGRLLKRFLFGSPFPLLRQSYLMIWKKQNHLNEKRSD